MSDLIYRKIELGRHVIIHDSLRRANKIRRRAGFFSALTVGTIIIVEDVCGSI